MLKILPSSSTSAILLAFRSIYSCIPLKAIQYYIIITSVQEVWIGLQLEKINKTWVWMTGEQLKEDKNWEYGYPKASGSCAFMWKGKSTWRDRPCTERGHGLCERRMYR